MTTEGNPHASIWVSADDSRGRTGAPAADIRFRSPASADGKAVWQLVKDSQKLDLNSAYLYVLQCDRFADTCMVAETEGRIVGFVSGFVSPKQPDVLFVWQIAVDASMRGQGVASRLLEALLAHECCAGVRYVEATISPSNGPSQALFRSLAHRRDCACAVLPHDGYAAHLFPDGSAHEDEWLYRIGPIRELLK